MHTITTRNAKGKIVFFWIAMDIHEAWKIRRANAKKYPDCRSKIERVMK
jgi:hypothetical protein